MEPAGIAEAERAMSLEFPADLVELLRCHDGADEGAVRSPDCAVLPGAGLSPTHRIVRTWQRITRHARATGVPGKRDGPGEEPLWHPSWIPWAGVAYQNGVIDMRPGPRCGQVVPAWGWKKAGEWPSLAAYFEAVADALYAGGDVDDYHPYLAGRPSRLLWVVNPHPSVVADAGMNHRGGTPEYTEWLLSWHQRRDSAHQLRPIPTGLH
ncbi:SMI1/KNR4 family protein [Streptomyces sp. SBT349]|uniref:SMI1/KNR4 family protein n=1 Tax=Streptomyces sp. SBT349 TaxID=1580539 RepID=UPI00131AA82B|nr:SMI1/KNR4 family protein [Streptomyces sp. SBT349]